MRSVHRDGIVHEAESEGKAEGPLQNTTYYFGLDRTQLPCPSIFLQTCWQAQRQLVAVGSNVRIEGRSNEIGNDFWDNSESGITSEGRRQKIGSRSRCPHSWSKRADVFT